VREEGAVVILDAPVLTSVAAETSVAATKITTDMKQILCEAITSESSL